ncbi:MAG: hypothetical protein JWQ49_5198 [Edaphobacter sp.]|nr:hypothetical protein [Edaphobacter sp.]
MKLVLAILIAATLRPSSVAAQIAPAKKIPIYLTCTCDDPVSQQVASALRDKLTNSPRYTETKDSVGETTRHLRVLSLDPERGGPYDNHGRTVLSSVVTIGPNSYITNWVEICGSLRIDSCASGLISSIDELLNP